MSKTINISVYDLEQLESDRNRCFELEQENKKLREEKEIRALNDRDNLIQIEKLEKENKKLKENIAWYKKEEDSMRDIVKENRKLTENEKYRHSRCMKAERQIQHSLGWDDELIYEEWLYD